MRVYLINERFAIDIYEELFSNFKNIILPNGIYYLLCLSFTIRFTYNYLIGTFSY